MTTLDTPQHPTPLGIEYFLIHIDGVDIYCDNTPTVPYYLHGGDMALSEWVSPKIQMQLGLTERGMRTNYSWPKSVLDYVISHYHLVLQ